MHHFAITLCAGIVATVVLGGTALAPTPAEAAKTPSPEAAALKQAIVACKAEAKGKKIRWPASRKFVSTCLSNALKDYHLDVALLRRELNMAGLRSYTPEETGCLQNVYCEE
jgi:hypothetical protein